MQKRILILFIMTFIYAMFFVPVTAVTSDGVFIGESIIYNLENVEEKALKDLYYSYPTEIGKRKVKALKKLFDFDNNYYNLVEFFPCGYSIYCDDFSIILETSAKAQSPYYNKKGKCLYFGAFNYYVQDSLDVEHNVINDCIYEQRIELSIENKKTFKSFSINLNNNILENKKSIFKNNILAHGNEGFSIQGAFVSQPTIIEDSDTSGLNVSDECGYVAGSLLIFYAAKAWGWSHLYDRNVIDRELVEEIKGKRSGPSWAPDLESALNDYLNSHNSSNLAKVNMWNIPAAHTFFDRVKEDKPCILFGNVPSGGIPGNEKINHAVVVYKVSRHCKTGLFGINSYSDYKYTVHWGLDHSRNDVIISHDAISIGGLVNLHK